MVAVARGRQEAAAVAATAVAAAAVSASGSDKVDLSGEGWGRLLPRQRLPALVCIAAGSVHAEHFVGEYGAALWQWGGEEARRREGGEEEKSRRRGV